MNANLLQDRAEETVILEQKRRRDEQKGKFVCEK